MIYTVRHLTTYRYARTVGFARCTLRLTPREGDGQCLLSSDIIVTPAAASQRVDRTFFDSQTVTLTIDQPHRSFSVEATSRVAVMRSAPPDPAWGPSWEEVRDTALRVPGLDAESPVHFMFPSLRTPILPALTDFARDCFPPGEGAYAGATALMERIRAEFRFDGKATTVSTPIEKAFAQRAGVCQDFAQIMIAGLRGLGLPAAYVSGYLRTTPPPGRPRLRGADASHAWVSVWCGQGWVGLDPTNNVPVRDDHVELTRGRDYSDVAPIDGIVTGAGGQRLKVEVDVVPDGEAMPSAGMTGDSLVDDGTAGDGLAAP